MKLRELYSVRVSKLRSPRFWLWQTCYVLMFHWRIISSVKNRKDLSQSPLSEIKGTKPVEKHKVSLEQENCYVKPRITEHRLQVLNEVKQFYVLNSHIIIRSQGVISRIVFPSTSEERSRRSREQIPAIKRSCYTFKIGGFYCVCILGRS